MRDLDSGEHVTITCRYLAGCDGARSVVSALTDVTGKIADTDLVSWVLEYQPAGGADYEKRGTELRERMRTLHKWALQKAGELPADKIVVLDDGKVLYLELSQHTTSAPVTPPAGAPLPNGASA